MPICGNCDHWYHAKITSRGDKGTLTNRECPAAQKRVNSQTKSCKYYNPVYFHCDKNNCRLTIDQCLSRRRNHKNLVGYQNCKKCRQFDKEIREVVEMYYLDMVPIVTPRHLARGNDTEKSKNKKVGSGKIKRRKKKEGGRPNGKRKIKRREKPKTEGKRRKIKRRDKSKVQTAGKPKRKIKRRSR